jgi:hypothetical protein
MRYVRTNDKFIACQSITALFEVITSKRQQLISCPKREKLSSIVIGLNLLRRRP